MNPLVIDIAIAVASLAVFAAAYGVALLATRPARPRPAPATPDLGDEPPAVVNLLANRWRLNEDAAESTLLDLAARRVIELRQPADDPRHTTVHMREEPPGDLRPYERKVLDRVRGLAVDGVLPVTALTFRNEHEARRWTRGLHRMVIGEAHHRGLSRRRFSAGLKALLVGVAAITATGLAVAALRYGIRNPTEEDSGPGLAIGTWIMSLLLLGGVASAQRGERDTPAGRAAAARWLGVREWLRAHEEFADLPPAAVAVWDRYLPYGAALGVTHTASTVLDLGMGNRRLVWSSYGGAWRRVRVRYPRFWSRYGRTVPSLLFPALFMLLAGGLLVRFHQVPADLDLSADALVDRIQNLSVRIGLVLGVVLLAHGGYRALRALVDLATTRTITGEVLWLEAWRTQSQGSGDNRRRVTVLYYLAVDEGRADKTTAWAMPVRAYGRCRDGDTVTIRVRPWSRRIAELTLVERGRAYQLGGQAVEPAGPVTARAGAAVVTALTRPAPITEGLLTTDEVGQALGMAIRAPESAPVPGLGMGMTTFRTADRGRQALLLQSATGMAGQFAWRSNRRGTTLSGIGDEAYHNGDRAIVRVGDTTVVLTLLRDARGRHTHLPWLLQQIATRLTGPGPAAEAAAPAAAPAPGEPAPAA